MASVTAYTTSKTNEICDATVKSGSISGDDLIATKHDDSTENLGTVRGPDGDPGPIGDASQDDLDASFEAITPGVWQSLVLLATTPDVFGTDTSWAEHVPGSGYAQARYRQNGDMLELDGWMKYTGDDHDGTKFITLNWPISMAPQSGTTTVSHAYRNGRYVTPVFWMGDDPLYPGVWGFGLIIPSWQPSLVTGEWVNFTGISVPIA